MYMKTLKITGGGNYYLFVIFLNYLTCSNYITSAVQLIGQNSYCGRLDSEKGSCVEGSEPWSAAIFTREGQNDIWKYFGEGALISNTTVITSAELFMTKFQRKLELSSFDNYIVVLGLNSSKLPEELDPLSDYSQVSYIRIHERVSESFEFSVAVLHLKKQLEYSAYVNELCVPQIRNISDFKHKTLVHPGNLVRMGGYGISGDNPLLFPTFDKKDHEEKGGRMGSELILKDPDFCQKQWKFFEKWQEMPRGLHCALPYNGTDAENGNWPKLCHRGSAVVALDGPRNSPQYFIVGIFVKYFEVAQSTDITKCTNRSVYFFLDLFTHLDWIIRNLRCGGSKFACTTSGDSSNSGNKASSECVDLFQVCDGQKDCPQEEDEDREFCKIMKHCPKGKFECGPFGTCIKETAVCDDNVDCINGEDESKEICEKPKEDNPPGGNCSCGSGENSGGIFGNFENPKNSEKGPAITGSQKFTCPQLVAPQNAKISCISRSGTAGNDSCLSGGILGSKVMMECDKFYISKEEISILELVCLESGKWFPETDKFHCKIDCGRGDASGIRPLIVNGWETSVASWPWHGKLCYKTNEGMDCICGVTLISDSVVLTAAHCLSLNFNKDAIDPEDFEVILGSDSPDYYDNKNRQSSVQRFQVKEVAIPSSFNPRSFEGDIAVMHLSRKVILTIFVRPVCFPFPGEKSLWLETYQLVPGVIGYVPGFGINEMGELPSGLRAVGVPYIAHSECAASLDRNIFPSQFCAGYKNGSATCNGDSGGGIVFSQGTGLPSTFYIQGVVSNSEPLKGTRRCNYHNYAVFTKVSYFAKWIQEQISRF